MYKADTRYQDGHIIKTNTLFPSNDFDPKHSQSGHGEIEKKGSKFTRNAYITHEKFCQGSISKTFNSEYFEYFLYILLNKLFKYSSLRQTLFC